MTNSKLSPNPTVNLGINEMDLFSLEGKNALVTGGGRGIGEMIAGGLLKAGCANVYIASRDVSACERVAAQLNGLGLQGRVHAFKADLTTLDDCKQLVRQIEAVSPVLHVLVNNSGNNWAAKFDDYPDAAWDRVLTLNLKRIFTLTQLCTPLLERAARPEDPARIINIGSIDGIRVPLHPTFAYSASKAGLHHLSRHLATQLGPRFITSNTIACGAFESKMMHATLSKFGDKIRKSVPLGRIGEPSDVAGTVIYLASKAGAYTTGATIRVDGGASINPHL